MAQKEFVKELEKSGVTLSQFREHVRKQILAISMGIRKRREFEKAVQVSETEVAQYYQDHRDELARPERAQVRRIFLAAGQDPDERARVKMRLEGLRGELDAGAGFAQLATTCSEAPEAAQGGALGWIAHGDLVETLEQAVFSLPENAVSEVLETEYGFHLLKVERKEAAGTASLDEVRTQIEPKLRGQYADEQYRKWISELRKRSRVRVYL